MQASAQKISGLEAFREKCLRFFFAPASALPLAWLRITLSATLLAQAWLVSSDLYELYGSTGIMQETLARVLVDGSLPRLSWILPLFEKFGTTEKSVILGTAIFYVLSLSALFFGVYTRIAAFCAWFLHWTLMNTGYHTNYGADSYAHIFLFYLVWMPSGLALSVDSLRKNSALKTSEFVRLSIRIIQIHLCISYFCSGLAKAMGPQWQNGEVIWRALNLPVYQQFDMSWLASYPWIAKTFSWGTLVVELGYGVFIWPRQTRKLWLCLTLSLHLGIAVFLGLHIFGFLMTFFTLCVYGVSADLTNQHLDTFIKRSQGSIDKRVDATCRIGSKFNEAIIMKGTSMNKLIISWIICIGLISGVAVANTESNNPETTNQIAAEGVTPLEKDLGANDLLDRTHWDFITCVHTNHECYDEAIHHGYPHYRAVHDSHLCGGHAHYACYGGHH